MSNIGKKPIIIPESVKIELINDIVKINGIFGELIQKYNNNIITLKLDKNKLNILLTNYLDKKNKEYYGLIRTLIYNSIYGVTYKFKKSLSLEGIGYKFKILENILYLYIGYNHPILFNIPNNILLKLESPIKLHIEGIDLKIISQFAANIYNIYPPEPYKGKGIYYENQKIIKKIGKKGK
jgi:large subunit ribosomal protein L6